MAEQLERANTNLEDWISGMPGPVADFFNWALTPLKEPLEWVSGDPDDLIRGAQVWADAAEQMRGLREEHSTAAETLRSSWKDDAGEAFEGMQGQLDQALQQMAEAMDGVKELLVSAAEAAVEAFNLLLDLLMDIMLMILTDFILSAALSVLSFGASVAAWIAKSLAKVLDGVNKFRKIIDALVKGLMKIVEFMNKVKAFAQAYKTLIMDLRKFKKGLSFFKKGDLALRGLAGLPRLPAKLAFNAVSPIDIAGGKDVAQDVWGTGRHVVDGARTDHDSGERFDESVLDRDY